MKKTNSTKHSTAGITVQTNISKRHFIVTAKCGHVRKANYIPIDFPVAADTAKEAAAIARQLPRVKHDHKDAILAVREVSFEEYCRQSFINKNDPFLRITNKRDHEALEPLFEHRILPEAVESLFKATQRETSRQTMHFGKERIRNPKKWARMNDAA